MPPSDQRYPENDVETGTAVPVPFRYKGIGANLFLTAAAALVPMLILGVSAYMAVTDQKRSAKGKRPASK